MQFTTSTLLFIVALSSLPSHSEATLRFLFDLLLRPLVGPACDLVQSELGLEGTADCNCDLSYGGLFQGFTGNVECTIEEQCLQPPKGFCASGLVQFGAEAGLFLPTGITSNIGACFDVKSGLPFGLDDLNGEICFDFKAAGLRLDDCDVRIGDELCETCDVCPSGTDFKFNCTNIVLLELGDVRGPAIEDCIGLSTVPPIQA